MKSLVCLQPKEFMYREENLPSIQDGMALVRIKRVGICGTDLHAYRGVQPFFTYPRILGHELAGVIEDVSGNNAGLKCGDQVTIIPYVACGICFACRSGKTNCCSDLKVIGVHRDGGMREYITVPLTNVIKTEGVSLDQAAMVEPLAIGAHAVRRAQLRKGDTVLVIGAGPIGLGVMAFAKEQGAKVIAMDVNEDRLKFCKEWAKVEHTVQALNSPVEKVEALTNGDMPSVVFDATGNVQSMTQAFHYVSHSGKLVYVGLVKSDIQFFDPDFHKKEMILMGSRNATREDFDYVLSLLSSNYLNINKYISHRCHFDDLTEQFDKWLLPESNVIKAIVEFS
ncbi:zinc-binding alcohol dehydrogenase family protein [Halalkalibacter urbisdiaboli]|uniref:zinc-binding alcohol dehydrogenase family protein n=1 Tax=Halalkalibacter urbisdiaboli TaxID=1960589 RepID=UPI000B42D3E2|nr:zinc-binding alcohol dehydrogenase family protein [Halalkalibacter urbisdiaboli]